LGLVYEERGVNEKRTWKAVLGEIWRGWCRPILIVVVVTSTLRSAVADWNDVPTGSMKPTILAGDRIFVNKLAYDLKVPFTRRHVAKWDDPARGDVVVLFSPADEKRLVKRVVGLPGDQVELRDNRVLINGQPVEYGPPNPEVVRQMDALEQSGRVFVQEKLDSKVHAVMLTPGQPSPRWYGPVGVPDDHYFVMGDNRDNSADSRWFGFVGRSRIVGRSSRVALSVDPANSYWPRWGRFLRKLD
jgi:signal peptidase I